VPSGTDLKTLVAPRGMRHYTLAVLAIVYMFNFVDRQLLAILLPSIKAEFAVGDLVLGLLTGPAFALFYIGLGLPVARLADRVNRRNLIALAVALWSGMTALSGSAANLAHLVLARIGVGIGEAGFSPPAQSMIADLYPPARRSAAMGIFTLGISAGIMLAYLAGGWLVQNFGWREAFYLVGLPGLLLALVVRYTLREPVRGATEMRADGGRQPSLRAVATFLLAQKSFIYLALGAGLSSFAGYSVIFYLPSFLARSFDTGVASIGFWLGLIYGCAGGLGFFLGGIVADRVGMRGHGRALRLIAAATFSSAIFYGAVFLSTQLAWGLGLLVLPTLIANFYLAPVMAQTQGLVSLRMRAVAASIMVLVINAIGLVLGPPLTGLLSDLLHTSRGNESMRYALLITCCVVLPAAAYCYWRAGDSIDDDLLLASKLD